MTMEICISARTGLLSPCFANNQADLDLFLKDNAHINNDIMHKGTVYVSRSDQSNNPNVTVKQDLMQMVNQLQALPPKSRQTIGQLNDALGSDLLLSLSSFYNNEILPLSLQCTAFGQNTVLPLIKKESVGFAGAAMTATSSRSTQFAKLITEYQKALEAIRAGYKNKLPKFQLMKLEQVAEKAHQTLNDQFRTELRRYMPSGKGNKGTVWSNAQRGINQAKSSRAGTPIRLNNTNEIAKLRNFSKGVNVAGNGLLILDGVLRGTEVYSDYENGKDWQRRMVTETAGFGLGAGVGIASGQAATLAATVFLASTPVGWAIAIGIGLTVGYGMAKAGDYAGKKAAGFAYDTSSSFNWFN